MTLNILIETCSDYVIMSYNIAFNFLQEKLDDISSLLFVFVLFRWSYLKVVTNENYDDYVQAFAAGYVESYLTFELIHNHWLNTQSQYCNKPSEYCSKLSDFLDKQEQYIQGELDRCEATDSYWHQIGLALTQLNGIIEGYGNATNGMDGYEISRRGFL